MRTGTLALMVYQHRLGLIVLLFSAFARYQSSVRGRGHARVIHLRPTKPCSFLVSHVFMTVHSSSYREPGSESYSLALALAL